MSLSINNHLNKMEILKIFFKLLLRVIKRYEYMFDVNIESKSHLIAYQHAQKEDQ